MNFTQRQKSYKRNRLAGMNEYNAARAAHYSESYSRAASRIEKSVKVSIQEHLEQAGLTEEYEAQKLFELTQCADPTVRLNTLRHIALLKGKISKNPLIDQSQHTHITSIAFNTPLERLVTAEAKRIEV